MKYYISDLHFGHKNIIGYDIRPFYSVNEMDKSLIDNWNSVVKDDDEVYILGDMFWVNAYAPQILSQLKGKKYLILGNHDRITEPMQDFFVWIKEMAVVVDGEDRVVLCHYPLGSWKNRTHGYIHLYGHVHQTTESKLFEDYVARSKALGHSCAAYNVGCMCEYMNYTPRTLNQIMTHKKAESQGVPCGED